MLVSRAEKAIRMTKNEKFDDELYAFFSTFDKNKTEDKIKAAALSYNTNPKAAMRTINKVLMDHVNKLSQDPTSNINVEFDVVKAAIKQIENDIKQGYYVITRSNV